MKRIALTLTVCLISAVASTAVAAPPAKKTAKPAGKPELLKKERDRLNREVRYKLYGELGRLRRQAEQAKDLAALREKIAQAQQAYEKKVKGDRKIAAAAAAAEKAGKAMSTAAKAAAAKDRMSASMKRELTFNEQMAARAEADRRMAKFTLGEAERRLAVAGALRAQRDAARSAERAAYGVARSSEKLAAARKAAAEARSAYMAKIKTLPEYKAMVQAQETYQAALKSDKAYQSAVSARDKARKTYQAALDAALAADALAKSCRSRMTRAEATIKSGRERVRSVQDKMRAAARTAAEKDPGAQKAREACTAAWRAHLKTIHEQAGKERDAVNKSRLDLYAKTREKLAADPKAKAIQQQIDKVNAQIRELDKQIRALEPTRPSRTRRGPIPDRRSPRSGTR